MAFTNSQGQPFALVPVPIPAMPANLTAELRQELQRLYVEYGQLHHIYYNQCPLQADRALARAFWNQHGPVNGRGQRPNWTSDRMLGDRLSKARADIRRLGGNPHLVEQALAQSPAPAAPPPPPPVAAPAPSPALVIPPPAPSQGPVFRPNSPPDMYICPLIPNARSHVTPPWPIPENLSEDNLPPGWTYTNPAIDYGYGVGFRPPIDPAYVAEWERRKQDWYREVREDNEIFRLWNAARFADAEQLARDFGRITNDRSRP